MKLVVIWILVVQILISTLEAVETGPFLSRPHFVPYVSAGSMYRSTPTSTPTTRPPHWATSTPMPPEFPIVPTLAPTPTATSTPDWQKYPVYIQVSRALNTCPWNFLGNSSRECAYWFKPRSDDSIEALWMVRADGIKIDPFTKIDVKIDDRRIWGHRIIMFNDTQFDMDDFAVWIRTPDGKDHGYNLSQICYGLCNW